MLKLSETWRPGILALSACLAFASAGANADSPLDPAAGRFLDTDLDVLSRRAFVAYQQGDYFEAARRYLDLLRHDIGNADALYSLAGCFGLLGEPELAGRYLARAFRAAERRMFPAGPAAWKSPARILRDPDFALVADKAAFRRVVDSLARAAADREHTAGERVFIAARSYFDCRVKLPPGFDPGRRYALVVGLHESGGSPESFVRRWPWAGTDPQFIFVAPRAPYPAPGGAGYSWLTEADSATRASVRAASEEYVLDVVRLLSTRYNVGDVYLFGFSEGGDIAWTTGLRNPRHFRGLVCFGSRLDTVRVRPADLENARQVRVFIGHGREDEQVGYEEAVRARELLTGLGYDVTLLGFDGGHGIPPEAARRVAEWLRVPRAPGR